MKSVTLKRARGNLFEPPVNIPKEAIEKYQTKSKETHLRNKAVCIAWYSNGTMRCSNPKCKDSNIKRLQLDHVNDDGEEHRKQLRKKFSWVYDKTGAGNAFYEHLIRSHFPKDIHLQVLCEKCNLSKKHTYELKKRIHPNQISLFEVK